MIQYSPTLSSPNVPSRGIRLFIHDPNPIVRQGLAAFFTPFPDFEDSVVEANQAAVATRLPKSGANLLLLGMTGHWYQGIELLCRLRKTSLTIPVICFADVTHPLLHKNLKQAGVSGIIPRNASPADIRKTLTTFFLKFDGGHSLPPCSEIENAPLRLSKREKSILGWIIAGYSTKQIAILASISVHTVDFHRRSLMQKFEAENVAALVREGMAFGYGDGEPTPCPTEFIQNSN